MKSPFDQLVNDELAPLFKRHGFRKKGLNFARRNADGWSIVQLQKFHRSTRAIKEFAINVSVFSDRVHREVPPIGTRVLRPDAIPPEFSCHLRRRLRQLVADRSEPDHYEVSDTTDLAALGAKIRSLLENHALPFLDALATDRGLHAYWSMHSAQLREGLYYAVLVRAFDTPDAFAKIVAHIRATTNPGATKFLETLDELAPHAVERVKPDPVTRQMLKVWREALAVEGDPLAHDRRMERCLALDDGEASNLRGDPSMPPFRLRPYISYANALTKRGAPGRAVALLEPLLARWPDEFILHLALAAAFDAIGVWNRAEAACRRANEIEPTPYVCVMAGKMVDHQGQRADEAIAWLHRALEIDPDYEEAHFNLGCIDERNGDVDAAIARFRRALELDPEYAVARARLGALLNRRSR